MCSYPRTTTCRVRQTNRKAIESKDQHQKLSFKKAGKDVSGVTLKSTIKEGAKVKKVGKKAKKEEAPKAEEKKAE